MAPSSPSHQGDTPAARLVLPLAALNRQSLPLAGGKAANLGELIRAGFPVPAGFCVTTAAYADAAAAAKLDHLLGQPQPKSWPSALVRRCWPRRYRPTLSRRSAPPTPSFLTLNRPT